MTSRSPAPPGEPDSAFAAVGWTRLTERLTVCSRVLRRIVDEQVEDFGAGSTPFWLLWACSSATENGIGQSQLAEVLALSPAHVSATVEQLREVGFIEGRRHPDDRRKQLWTITPAGQVALAKSVARLGRWAQDLEQRYGAERREEFTALVGELLAALQGVAYDHRIDPPQTLQGPAPTVPLRAEDAR